MPLVSEKSAGLILFGIVCIVAALVPLLIAVHFLMPKRVAARYWRQPHFGALQLAALSGAFWLPVRTAMLLAAIAFPSIAAKRGMPDVVQTVPLWCRVLAKILGLLWIGLSIALLTVLIALVVHFHVTGQIRLWPDQKGSDVDWGMTIAAGVFTVGVVVLGIRWVLAKQRGRKRAAVRSKS